jgi:hypothetical protein
MERSRLANIVAEVIQTSVLPRRDIQPVAEQVADAIIQAEGREAEARLRAQGHNLVHVDADEIKGDYADGFAAGFQAAKNPEQ